MSYSAPKVASKTHFPQRRRRACNMAEFVHQGNNEMRLHRYGINGSIVQTQLDLSGLPTGPLLGQEDPNSSDVDDDGILGWELFLDPTGNAGLLAGMALNATAYAAAHGSDNYPIVNLILIKEWKQSWNHCLHN